eukprot:TRINITY_DN29854_c0_g1_i1.p1 TRINITY_DN29854_c0_g1~~TRINITY_DN29854_c0_g1_i1.p1  ORF type:complete len:655 (+),score=202.84 TRINITY_DN29854_c0_g1_i1:78-2042(+)
MLARRGAARWCGAVAAAFDAPAVQGVLTQLQTQLAGAGRFDPAMEKQAHDGVRSTTPAAAARRLKAALEGDPGHPLKQMIGGTRGVEFVGALTPKEAGKYMLGMARLQALQCTAVDFDAALWATCVARALNIDAADANLRHFARALLACGLVGYTEGAVLVMEAVEHTVLEERYNAEEVAVFVEAAGRAKVGNDRVFDAVTAKVHRDLVAYGDDGQFYRVGKNRSFAYQPADLAAVSWGLAAVRYDDTAAFASIADFLVKQRADEEAPTTHYKAPKANSGYSRLDITIQHLQIRPTLALMDVPTITRTLASFAAVEHKDPLLIQTATEELVYRINRFAPADLVTAAYAFGTLEAYSPEFMLLHSEKALEFLRAAPSGPEMAGRFTTWDVLSLVHFYSKLAAVDVGGPSCALFLPTLFFREAAPHLARLPEAQQMLAATAYRRLGLDVTFLPEAVAEAAALPPQDAPAALEEAAVAHEPARAAPARTSEIPTRKLSKWDVLPSKKVWQKRTSAAEAAAPVPQEEDGRVVVREVGATETALMGAGSTKSLRKHIAKERRRVTIRARRIPQLPPDPNLASEEETPEGVMTLPDLASAPSGAEPLALAPIPRRKWSMKYWSQDEFLFPHAVHNHRNTGCGRTVVPKGGLRNTELAAAA